VTYLSSNPAQIVVLPMTTLVALTPSSAAVSVMILRRVSALSLSGTSPGVKKNMATARTWRSARRQAAVGEWLISSRGKAQKSVAWNIAGKTILITGATSGIGLEASVALARLGANILVIGRDPRRTDAAIAAVRARASASAQWYLCDFASQASIRELAAAILRDHNRLDVLVNNAGGVNKSRSLTVDGIETTFATNHLGGFMLTNLLLDLVVASAPARVVTVASAAHRSGTMDFDDLGFERGYRTMRAYARSKLANVLFAAELARRLSGTGVASNSLHPGAVATNIWLGAPLWAKPLITLFRPFFISAEAGAATIVRLAADPDVEGITGRYFENQKVVRPSRLAGDAMLARRLWDVSEKLTGMTGAIRI
jgi:retinol dehydrogenase-14